MKYLAEYYDDVKKVSAHVPHASELFGKSVLVTGATGLIGSGIVDILHSLNKEQDAGIKIIIAGRSAERVAKRFYEMQAGADYKFVYYDSTKDLSVLSDLGVATVTEDGTFTLDDYKADFIIHGAVNASPQAYASEPVETMEANFIGLNNLMKLAKAVGTKRVLYISSSEVYGQKDNMDPFKEDDYGFLDILNQRASYPSSKRASETLCVAYSNEYGTESVIVRPGHIYGPAVTPSDNKATVQFTKNAVAGEDIVMKSAGTQLRSYTYFLDCASAILAVLVNGENCQAYNISNPDSIITISQIARCIANAVGMDIKFENPSDAEAAGYNLMSNSSLDSTKLEALGWKAEFSPEEGARACVKFF